jgi:hypothetical protein
MLLSLTEVTTRSLEHHLRIDQVNRTGWLVPTPHTQRHTNPFATFFSAVKVLLVTLRNSVGLGTRMRKGGARGVA